MDPLSITTACLALLSAVSNATRFVTDFVISCREARNDIAAVSRELSDLDITLHILKQGAEASELNQLPEDLRQHIRHIMANCTTVLVDLEALLRKYQGPGLDRATKWTLFGRKEAEKIRVSLETHKRALGLVVEVTTLHMTHVLAVDTSKIIHDSAIIKENTMKIVEQLTKQDKILEQIAWDRAVLSQRSETAQGKLIIMDKYFESLTEYAGSVCEDSVSEDVAQEMRVQSMDGSSSSAAITNTLEPSPMSEETTDLVTLVIGNTHRLVTPAAGSSNKHVWKFYLLTSGPEIIEEVKVYLHQTFRPPSLILRSPPYEVTRIGWGHFSIRIQVILKRGYLWCEANGRVLRLDWMLNLRSMGSSASHEYAVTVQGDKVHGDVDNGK